MQWPHISKFGSLIQKSILFQKRHIYIFIKWMFSTSAQSVPSCYMPIPYTRLMRWHELLRSHAQIKQTKNNCKYRGEFKQIYSNWLSKMYACMQSIQPPGQAVTHCGLDKVADISQTTFSNAFSWMEICEFRLTFHWSLFLWIKLTIFQHWFR